MGMQEFPKALLLFIIGLVAFVATFPVMLGFLPMINTTFGGSIGLMVGGMIMLIVAGLIWNFMQDSVGSNQYGGF